MQKNKSSRERAIVLFDALCPLCTHTETFLVKQDRKDRLSFISMQSQAGKNLMAQHKITLKMNTFAFIKKSNCLIRSDAVLEIGKQLGGAWVFLSFFRVIPRPLRDLCYTFVAKNRYRWFGKHQTCKLPSIR